MPRIKWDEIGKRLYETGVDRGVVYPQSTDGTYPKGAPWNGLSAVNEKPSGAEPSPLYANNSKYLELMSAEDFGGGIEAFTYPEEFGECNGEKELAPGVYITQQERKPFGFSYRNLIGNDTEKTKYGYKLHLVYGALAKPSEKNNTTVNESPEAATLSWEFSTTPVKIEGFDPVAHLVFDSTKVDGTKLKALEDILYGTESEEARLPLPSEIVELFAATGTSEPEATEE